MRAAPVSKIFLLAVAAVSLGVSLWFVHKANADKEKVDTVPDME